MSDHGSDERAHAACLETYEGHDRQGLRSIHEHWGQANTGDPIFVVYKLQYGIYTENIIESIRARIRARIQNMLVALRRCCVRYSVLFLDVKTASTRAKKAVACRAYWSRVPLLSRIIWNVFVNECSSLAGAARQILICSFGSRVPYLYCRRQGLAGYFDD